MQGCAASGDPGRRCACGRAACLRALDLEQTPGERRLGLHRHEGVNRADVHAVPAHGFLVQAQRGAGAREWGSAWPLTVIRPLPSITSGRPAPLANVYRPSVGLQPVAGMRGGRTPGRFFPVCHSEPEPALAPEPVTATVARLAEGWGAARGACSVEGAERVGGSDRRGAAGAGAARGVWLLAAEWPWWLLLWWLLLCAV